MGHMTEWQIKEFAAMKLSGLSDWTTYIAKGKIKIKLIHTRFHSYSYTTHHLITVSPSDPELPL
jgi:hypothetical protein